jgi:hypothetical protein
MASQAASCALPPHVQLIQMATGAWVARTLHAAAMLGLADQLTSGPKSAAELAGPMRAHVPSLRRLMRTLASLGILAEQKDWRYALTALGEALKTGAPGSARSTVLAFGSPWAQSAWDHLVYSVQTGKTGFEKAQGMPLFDYLAQHPEAASLFNETMVGFHSQEAASRRGRLQFFDLQNHCRYRRWDGKSVGRHPHLLCRTARRAVRFAACGGRSTRVT